MAHTINIITVAFNDNPDLAATYTSCQTLISDSGYHLNAVHWIFVKRYTLDISVRYSGAQVLPSDDNGIYNAMNQAFATIKERLPMDGILIYLNAGDLLDARPLFEHVRLHVQAGADISVASTTLTRAGARVGLRLSPRYPVTVGEIIFSDFPCHQSTFCSVRFLADVWARRGHLFIEELRNCADLELYLFAHGRAHIVTSPLVTSAYDIDGFSSMQSIAVAREKSRLVRDYRAGLRWQIFAVLWQLKARLVAPKRGLLRFFGTTL